MTDLLETFAKSENWLIDINLGFRKTEDPYLSILSVNIWINYVFIGFYIILFILYLYHIHIIYFYWCTDNM